MVALALVLALALVGAEALECRQPAKPQLACHFFPESAFNLDEIDPQLCTHLIHSGFKLETDGRLKTLEMSIDPNSDDPMQLRKLSALKSSNPSFKTLISIEEPIETDSFMEVTNSSELRGRFVANVMRLVRDNKLDGVHLDLDLISTPDGEAEQRIFRENLVSLVGEFRRELGKLSPCHLLYAQLSGNDPNTRTAYELAQLAGQLDGISLGSLLDSSANVTGLRSPMQPRKLANGGPDPADTSNADWMIEQATKAGLPKERLLVVLRLPVYHYILSSANDSGLGAPAHQEGQLDYGEFCSLAKELKMKPTPGEPLQGRYAHSETNWYGYHDPESAAAKARYLKEVKQVAGVAVRLLNMDDVSGKCDGEMFPLTKAIKRALSP